MLRVTKRYGGKTYKLFKSGATHGVYGLSEEEAKDIARRLRKKGWSVRVELNIWGNTKIWVRKSR